jgi:hypothetical protein
MTHGRDGRRDDSHLHEARRRIHVAGETRQDAAGLHVVELRQRQVEQTIEERLTQRQHEADVEDPLTVVLERPEKVRRDDDRQVRDARELQRPEPSGGVEGAVEQDAVDDEPHEQRLNHLDRGRQQREPENDRDGQPMRPQPRQIDAEIFATLGLDIYETLRRYFGRVLALFIEPPEAIIPDEGQEASA